MAKPIKETPILYGEDAIKFLHNISIAKPVSKEELERMKRNYEIFKKMESNK